MKEEAILGADRYFQEKEKGSLRDADLSQAEIEKRGIDLANFGHFVEMLQHEYSHLCSFEKLMDGTNWEDPHIGAHNMDYHLYDEMIARYRGTYAMLRMLEDYAERDLLYTLWMGYWEHVLKEFNSESEKMKRIIIQQRDEIERSILYDMRKNKLSGEDVVFEMELELGHPLKYDGELTPMGAPKLSPVEVVEFLMIDDFTDRAMAEKVIRRGLPLLYFAHNPYASYQGAQMVGLVESFYEFLAGQPGRSLDLNSLMLTPYYETVDVDDLRAKLDKFPDLFLKRR